MIVLQTNVSRRRAAASCGSGWQLSTPHQEVSMEQLSLHVRKSKLAVLERLISAIRASHDEIDAWVAAAQDAFPVIQDRGFQSAAEGNGYRSRPSCRWEMRQQRV